MQPDDEPSIVSYEEREIHEALQRLARRGWTRLASGAGSRAVKYRQLFDTELDLSPDEVAVLCVLMLRGPQTPGELKQRTERLHRVDTLAALHETLVRLATRELVRRLDRRPGQKEERSRHLLGGDEPDHAAPGRLAASAASASPASAASPGLEARVDALETEVARLGRELAALRGAGEAP